MKHPFIQRFFGDSSQDIRPNIQVIPDGKEEVLKKISESCNVDITKIGVISESLGLQIKGFDGPRSSYQHF